MKKLIKNLQHIRCHTVQWNYMKQSDICNVQGTMHTKINKLAYYKYTFEYTLWMGRIGVSQLLVFLAA